MFDRQAAAAQHSVVAPGAGLAFAPPPCRPTPGILEQSVLSPRITKDHGMLSQHKTCPPSPMRPSPRRPHVSSFKLLYECSPMVLRAAHAALGAAEPDPVVSRLSFGGTGELSPPASVAGASAAGVAVIPLDSLHKAIGPMRGRSGAAPARSPGASAHALGLLETEFDELSPICVGKFSRVLRVRHAASGAQFVIKHDVDAAAGRSAASLAREIEAIRVCAAVPHANVVSYYRAWQEAGVNYILMEHCARGSLDIYFGALAVVPEREIWRLLRDVASGLTAIHAADVVHLDIKQENIFVDASHTFKIGDFGIAAQLRSSQRAHNDDVDGDARYLPLELLLEGRVSTSCDVFGLGLIAYALASGTELPGHGEVWRRLRAGDLPLEAPPEASPLSADLTNLVAQMTHADAGARPLAADVAAQAQAHLDALRHA